MHDLENRPMTRMSPRRSYRPLIAMAVAIAMLMAGCGSSRDAGPKDPNLKVDAGTTAPSPQPLLYLRGDTVRVEVAIYAEFDLAVRMDETDPFGVLRNDPVHF